MAGQGVASEDTLQAVLAALTGGAAGDSAGETDQTIEVTTTTDADGNVRQVVEHNVTTGVTITTNYTTVVQS